VFAFVAADEALRYKVIAPVGMYNLGNTCFKSAILQCLVHCKPLQRYFLKDAGHHHQSCQLYRQKQQASKKKKTNGSTTKGAEQKTDDKLEESVCLACEMDRLFLSYYGSAVGKDVFAAIEEASRPLLNHKSSEEPVDPNEIEQGDPLIISDFLTATWKSGGMDHLAGYEQRDAHEFLNSFLDLLGKHIKQHRERVYASITTVKDDNAVIPKTDKTDDGKFIVVITRSLMSVRLKTWLCRTDIVKQLFEGALRSVLVCEECGGKRMLREAFMNISLTLSEEVERLQAENNASTGKVISVETCLEHFILPEKLGDGVHCPSCNKKTPTKKQHTFSKLPKILCLHLKRFDAARNRKIDEFVSFPARGLNMGTLLSHW
jgi:ubiquitin C-terminal hydrolase